jgi:hypothetical protein
MDFINLLIANWPLVLAALSAAVALFAIVAKFTKNTIDDKIAEALGKALQAANKPAQAAPSTAALTEPKAPKGVMENR